MNQRTYIAICLVILAAYLLPRMRGQDVAPLAATTGSTTVLNMSPPSSMRYIHPAAWFTDANPGSEGSFGMPSDDTNHIFVWHLNHWRTLTANTVINP